MKLICDRDDAVNGEFGDEVHLAVVVLSCLRGVRQDPTWCPKLSWRIGYC